MPVKTYLPTLVAIIALLVHYARRWQEQLAANMDAGQQLLFDSLLSAAEALLAAIIIVEGN